jgi:hypothetical protein
MQFWRLRAKLRGVCVRKRVSAGTLGRQKFACLDFAGFVCTVSEDGCAEVSMLICVR